MDYIDTEFMLKYTYFISVSLWLLVSTKVAKKVMSGLNTFNTFKKVSERLLPIFLVSRCGCCSVYLQVVPEAAGSFHFWFL